MSELARAIAAQGEAVERALTVGLDEALARLAPAARVWLVGTGTSQHAAELGAWMFAGGPRAVRWSSSASFSWQQAELSARDAVVVITHTGETAFARRARTAALRAGVALVSITALGSEWPEAIEIVPRERSETYTGSYLAALVVLARLAIALGHWRLDERVLDRLVGAVHAAAQPPAAPDLLPARLFVLAGVGPGAITAREGALKLREAARIPAEGYEAEYLLHGCAVPLGPGDALLAIQPDADASGLLPQLAAAAERAGVAVARVDECSDLDPLLAQLPLTVRLQALASRLADARGFDPDTVITGPFADAALWSAGAP